METIRHFFERFRILTLIQLTLGVKTSSATSQDAWRPYLLENELFGHVKGAFTDAGSMQIGLIAEAKTVL